MHAWPNFGLSDWEGTRVDFKNSCKKPSLYQLLLFLRNIISLRESQGVSGSLRKSKGAFLVLFFSWKIFSKFGNTTQSNITHVMTIHDDARSMRNLKIISSCKISNKDTFEIQTWPDFMFLCLNHVECFSENMLLKIVDI